MALKQLYLALLLMSATAPLSLRQPILIAGENAAISESDLLQKIGEQCDIARAHRGAGELDLVEAARRVRLTLVEQLLANGFVENSWAKAAKAIAVVDGYTSKDQQVLGLIDRLEYKAAYGLLAATAAEIKADGQVVPSELAARLFEVTQQAAALGSQVFEEDGDDGFASRKELVALLEEVSDTDPAGLILQPMLAYLQKPDPSEAFLRAEVRKSLVRRQEMLVGIGHSAILKNVKGAPRPANNVAVVAGQIFSSRYPGGLSNNSHSVTESGNAPVQPWHAGVELCKQQSLSAVLADIGFVDYIRPDVIRQPTRPVGEFGGNTESQKYIMPGVIVKAFDATGAPVELLYGCLLLHRAIDEEGRRRSAVSYVNPRGEWKRRYIDVLVRRPRDNGSDDGDQKLRGLLQNYPAAASADLNGIVLDLKGLPSGITERLLQAGAEVFCVNDAFQLVDTSYSNTRNDYLYLSRNELSVGKQVEAQISTSPKVKQIIEDNVKKRDQTRHPLRQLLLSEGISPLVLVSDCSEEAEPAWIFDEAAGEKYLMTPAGDRLRYVNRGPDLVRFELELPGGYSCHYPLTLGSIPESLLQRTRAYSVLEELLRESGYKGNDPRKELLRFFADPNYFPSKTRARMESRAVSRGLKSIADAIAESLESYGWSNFPSSNPRDSLLMTRLRFGIRYLQSRGGTFVCSSELATVDAPAGVENPAGVGVGPDYSKPPFLIVTSSGELLPERQQYSFRDYQELSANSYEEHGAKMVALSPSLGTARTVSRMLSDEIVIHPQDKPNPYVATAENSSGAAPSKREKLTSEFSVYLKELLSGERFNLTNPFSNSIDLEESVYPSLAALHLKRCKDVRALAQNQTLIKYCQSQLRVIRSQLFQNRLHGYHPQGVSRDSSTCSRCFWLAQQEFFQDTLQKAVDDLVEAQQVAVREAWSSARRFGAEGRLHRAIINYNDVGDLLVATKTLDTALFEGVPSSDRAEELALMLEEYCSERADFAAVELELAGVLAAAGKADSAALLWSEVVAQQKLLISPVIGLAREYMQAYGMRLSDSVADAGQGLSEISEIAERRLAGAISANGWRDDLGLAGRDDPRGVELERELKELSKDANSAEALNKLRAEFFSLKLGFAQWFRIKRYLHLTNFDSSGQGADVVGEGFTDFAPQKYSDEFGFESCLSDIFKRYEAEDILDWAQQEPGQRSVEDSNLGYLAAWYWHRASGSTKSRYAMRFAAEAASAAAGDLKGVSKAVQKRNAIALHIGSFGEVKLPFGVNSLRLASVDALEPQILLLERRWVADGYEAARIAQESSKLLDLLGAAGGMDLRAAERDIRWHFPDYEFEFGTIPDVWVERLLSKKDEVKDAMKEEVVEGEDKKLVPDEDKRKSWMLVKAEVELDVDSKKLEDDQTVNAKHQADIAEAIKNADAFVSEIYEDFEFGEYDQTIVDLKLK